MNIIQATKAHYMALQKRPGPGMIPLKYSVEGFGGELLNSGTVFVKVRDNVRKRMEMTKLTNRLMAMYAFEWKQINVSFMDDESL